MTINQIIGKWECTESENFEGILKEMAFEFLKRKFTSSIKPTIVYSECDGKISQAIVSAIMKSQIKSGYVNFCYPY